MNNTTDLKSFNYLENGKVTFSIIDTIKTVTKLDSGLYSLNIPDTYPPKELQLAKEESTELQELINYHFIEKIDKIIDKFYNKEVIEKVANLNYKHKLGIILHGKQGTSKSSILKHYYTKIIKEQNALVFYFTSYNRFTEVWDFITEIRKIQDNPILIYLDEFDQCFKDNKSMEDLFKVIMDGHRAIDNTLFLVATNYINEIPKPILDRPSRFKYSIEVEGLQDKELVYNFLKKGLLKITNDIKEDYLNDLTDKCIGKTVDELKEILLDIIMDIDTNKDKKIKPKLGFGK